MDLACILQQPNVLCSGEGTKYKVFDRFDSHNLLRKRYFSSSPWGTSRIALRTSTAEKIKKTICLSGFENTSFAIGAKSDSHGWSLSPRISLFHSFRNVHKGSRTVGLRCQNNDSLAYVNGNGPNAEFLESNGESSGVESDAAAELSGSREEGEKLEEVSEAPSLDELRELLQKAMTELEVARLNSTMFEEKAQEISEAAIALQDEAANAWNNVNLTLDNIQQIVNEESIAKEAVQKATMTLSLAEARLQVVVESLEAEKGGTKSADSLEVNGLESDSTEDEKDFLVAREDIKECQMNLANCEAELRRLQSKKEELQKEVDKLNEAAEKAQLDALKAEEDVANIMLLAEQAVAFELEATQRVNDAEIALQKAQKSLPNSHVDTTETAQLLSDDDAAEEKDRVVQGNSEDVTVEWDKDVLIDGASIVKPLPDTLSEKISQSFEDMEQTEYLSDHENGKLGLDSLKEAEAEAEKSKNIQSKKQETQKDLTRETSPLNAPKTLLKKSSRFFSASFFSFTVEGAEFIPASVFHGVRESVKKQWPKLIFGLFLFGAGYVLLFLLFNFFLSFNNFIAILFGRISVAESDPIISGLDSVCAPLNI